MSNLLTLINQNCLITSTVAIGNNDADVVYLEMCPQSQQEHYTTFTIYSLLNKEKRLLYKIKPKNIHFNCILTLEYATLALTCTESPTIISYRVTRYLFLYPKPADSKETPTSIIFFPSNDIINGPKDVTGAGCSPLRDSYGGTIYTTKYSNGDILYILFCKRKNIDNSCIFTPFNLKNFDGGKAINSKIKSVNCINDGSLIVFLESGKTLYSISCATDYVITDASELCKYTIEGGIHTFKESTLIGACGTAAGTRTIVISDNKNSQHLYEYGISSNGPEDFGIFATTTKACANSKPIQRGFLCYFSLIGVFDDLSDPLSYTTISALYDPTFIISSRLSQTPPAIVICPTKYILLVSNPPKIDQIPLATLYDCVAAYNTPNILPGNPSLYTHKVLLDYLPTLSVSTMNSVLNKVIGAISWANQDNIYNDEKKPNLYGVCPLNNPMGQEHCKYLIPLYLTSRYMKKLPVYSDQFNNLLQRYGPRQVNILRTSLDIPYTSGAAVYTYKDSNGENSRGIMMTLTDIYATCDYLTFYMGAIGSGVKDLECNDLGNSDDINLLNAQCLWSWAGSLCASDCYDINKLGCYGIGYPNKLPDLSFVTVNAPRTINTQEIYNNFYNGLKESMRFSTLTLTKERLSIYKNYIGGEQLLNRFLMLYEDFITELNDLSDPSSITHVIFYDSYVGYNTFCDTGVKAYTLRGEKDPIVIGFCNVDPKYNALPIKFGDIKNFYNIIIHELSHAIVETVDDSRGEKEIYGLTNCEAWSKRLIENPLTEEEIAVFFLPADCFAIVAGALQFNLFPESSEEHRRFEAENLNSQNIINFNQEVSMPKYLKCTTFTTVTASTVLLHYTVYNIYDETLQVPDATLFKGSIPRDSLTIRGPQHLTCHTHGYNPHGYKTIVSPHSSSNTTTIDLGQICKFTLTSVRPGTYKIIVQVTSDLDIVRVSNGEGDHEHSYNSIIPINSQSDYMICMATFVIPGSFDPPSSASEL
jgi:hypothetical protein